MRGPRLLVDARAPLGSGLGRYLRESVVALSRLDCFAEIVLAGPEEALASTCARMVGGVRIHPVPWDRYDPRMLIGWSRRVAVLVPGALTWLPYWDVPWAAPWSRTAPADQRRPVMTLHDLILYEAPGGRGLVARGWMRRAIPACRAFVAPSEASRGAFARAFPSIADRITVVPHGVSPDCAAIGTRAGLGDRSPTASPYLLCVANKRPHKRLDVAIAAFAELAKTDPALRLVLVGDHTPHWRELQALAERLGVGHRVEDVVGLSDAALADRYAGAEAVLVPSEAEGFGMVPLEAMAAGAPVVAAEHPTTREVVGDAAVLVPPADPLAMAETIRRWRRDPAARAAQVRRGRTHAERFSWDRSARGLAGVLLGETERGGEGRT